MPGFDGIGLGIPGCIGMTIGPEPSGVGLVITGPLVPGPGTITGALMCDSPPGLLQVGQPTGAPTIGAGDDGMRKAGVHGVQHAPQPWKFAHRQAIRWRRW